MAGVPQIAIPIQTEQLMIGRALAQQGAGVAVSASADAAAMAALVSRALAASALREGARAAAMSVAETTPQDPAGAAAVRLINGL